MKKFVLAIPFLTLFVASFSIGLADAQNSKLQNENSIYEYDDDFQPLPEDPGVEVAPLPMPSLEPSNPDESSEFLEKISTDISLSVENSAN